MPPPKAAARRTTAARQRTHPQLWDQVKAKWHRGAAGGQAGQWNARKAQLAVQEYKRRSQADHGDTGYRTKQPAAGNSLRKWTREDWGYAGRSGDSRYLPKAVREQLTPAERQRENAKKRGRKGQRVAYAPAVRDKMRRAGVF